MRCLRCGKSITESYSHNKEERPLCIKCLVKEGKALKESEDIYAVESEKETLYNILLNFIELKGCRATLVFSPSNITRVVEFNDKTDLANTRFESYIELLNSPASIEETEDGYSIVIDTGHLEFEEEDIDSFVTDLTMEDSTIFESVESFDELNDSINKVLKEFAETLMQEDNLTALDLVAKEDAAMYKVNKIIFNTTAPISIDDLDLVYKCIVAQVEAMVKEYPEVSEYTSINFFDVITESILKEDTQYDMDLEDANARLNNLIKDMREYVKSERESGCPEEKLKQLIKSNKKGFTRQLTLILDRSHLNQEDESKAREAIETMMSTLEFPEEAKDVLTSSSEEVKTETKECVSESLKDWKLKSPKRYVYEICDHLGWPAPTFIDVAAGGYRIRYREDSKEEAERKLSELLAAGKALNIPLVRPRIKEAGRYSVPMAEYDKLLDKYGIARGRFGIGADETNPRYDEFRQEACKMNYYFAAVAPRYEGPEDSNNKEVEDMKSKRSITKECKKHIKLRTKEIKLSERLSLNAYDTIASNLKYNGAEYRGADIPEARDGYINQCNLPDEMRLKHFNVKRKYEGEKEIVFIDYLCQEEYCSTKRPFEDELKNAIEYIYNRFGLEGVVTVEYYLHDRDGFCSDWGEFTVGSELTESEKIEEKLPKDLARAYNHNGRDLKSRFTDKIDYENANYTEITPEEAIEYRRQGKAGNIRAIISCYDHSQALEFRASDGYCYSSGYVDHSKAYTNKSGKTTTNVKEMPFSYVMKIADKIYYTDEDSTFIDDEKMKRREIDTSLTQRYRSTVYKKGQDRFRGQHKDNAWDKEAREQHNKRIAKLKQMLNDVQAKYDAGDLSRNEFERTAARYKSDLDYYVGQEYKSRKFKNEPTEYDIRTSRRTVDEFERLKSNAYQARRELTYAEQNLADIKKNSSDASSYSYYRNALASAREKVASLMKNIAYYEEKLSDDSVAKNQAEYETKVTDLTNELANIQSEIDKLLKRK